MINVVSEMVLVPNILSLTILVYSVLAIMVDTPIMFAKRVDTVSVETVSAYPVVFTNPMVLI